MGLPYSYFLTATGGLAPYTYTTDSAGLAFLASAGLTLNTSTGEVGSSGVALTTTVSFAAINFTVTGAQ